MLVLRFNIVHGGTFSSQGNTRLHGSFNIQHDLLPSLFDCTYAPTEAKLENFASFVNHAETFRLQDPPIYDDKLDKLFDGLHITPNITKNKRKTGRFAEGAEYGCDDADSICNKCDDLTDNEMDYIINVL